MTDLPKGSKRKRAQKQTIIDPSNLDEFMSELTDAEAIELFYDWKTWARPNQMVPSDQDW